MQVKTLAIITAAAVAVVLAAPRGAQAFVPVDMPPVCDPNGPYTIWVGTDLTLNGSGSWDDYGIIDYEWDIDLDGTADFFGEIVTVLWDDLAPLSEVGQDLSHQAYGH